MAYCTLCQKSFKTDPALRQHAKNSPAHNAVHCATCNKTFPHAQAVAQHMRDSPAHKEPHRCSPCQRSFPSQQSLNQHLQDSPAHAFSPNLTRSSSTLSIPLAQHPQTPSNHTTTTASHPCSLCDRSFATASALTQHTRNAPAHLLRDTPLDAFFRTYEADVGFIYDRAQLPSESFYQLRLHMRWRRGRDDAASSAAWEAYGAALREELEVWFGAEDDLANWHALCRAVGVGAPLLGTGGACAKALRGRHVNLVDLVQWGREGGQSGRVRVFGSVEELRTYCREQHKLFPLIEIEEAGEEGDGNVVIRHLLRRFGPVGKKWKKDSVVGGFLY